MAEPAESPAEHPLLVALAPLLDRVGGVVVAVSDLAPDDVPIVWDGEPVAGVRLPTPGAGGGSGEAGGDTVADLGSLLDDLAAELGGSLAELPRTDKQRAVRLLEQRGAFAYRKSAETVAEALGVSRFTVYNYLNRS